MIKKKDDLKIFSFSFQYDTLRWDKISEIILKSIDFVPAPFVEIDLEDDNQDWSADEDIRNSQIFNESSVHLIEEKNYKRDFSIFPFSNFQFDLLEFIISDWRKIKSIFLPYALRDPNFHFAFLGNEFDITTQSLTSLEWHELANYPLGKQNTKTCYDFDTHRHIVDISDHWGRAENMQYMRFAAAPEIWISKKIIQLYDIDVDFLDALAINGLELVQNNAYYMNFFDINETGSDETRELQKKLIHLIKRTSFKK